MAADEEGDIWGGLDDDDFMSINVSDNLVVSNNNGKGNVKTTPTASTSKLSTLIMSAASLGVRLADLVEATGKKQKQADGTPCTVVHVQANRKRRVYRGKKSQQTPLQRFKFGRLFVTDITAQFWCELQMVFKYEPPPKLEDIVIIPPAQVEVGKKLHSVREREIEKPVVVRVTSNEERFALKVLSLLDGVTSIVKHGVPIRREIHIFGTPFNMGVYVSGIIDEIRCQQETFELEIVEFKTRMTDCMPPDSQKLTHDIQVMLYKRLFDEMVDGTFSKETVASHFNMNLDRPFGKDLMAQIAHEGVDTLSKLLDLLVETMRGVPFISSLLVEYAFQKDGTTIGYSSVQYDETWLREKLTDALSYWKGEREPRGVSIEECWKCNRCDYTSACKWKSSMLKRYSLTSTKEVQPPKERPPTQEEKVDPWNSSAASLETSSVGDENNTLNNTDLVVAPEHEEQNIVEGDSNDSVILIPVEIDDPNDSVILIPEEIDNKTVIEH